MEEPNGHSVLGYSSVRTWIEAGQTTSLRPHSDRGRRLELIAGYVAHVGEDPDSIVANARADARAKNAYLRELKRWVGTLPGTDRHRHDAENAIRGFFMRNGFRVVARPYADVYRRPGSSE